MKKYAVVFEYDLENGLCYLARKNRGHGEVALFDSREEAYNWVRHGGDLDHHIWDINVIELP